MIGDGTGGKRDLDGIEGEVDAAVADALDHHLQSGRVGGDGACIQVLGLVE